MKLNSISEALSDLAKGAGVILIDEQDSKKTACFMMSGSHADSQRGEQLFRVSDEPLRVAVSAKIAQELFLSPVDQDGCGCVGGGSKKNGMSDTDILRVDYRDFVSDVKKIVDRISHPVVSEKLSNSHVYVAKPGGVLARAGFEEAATDLLMYAGLPAVAILSPITSEDLLRFDPEKLQNLVGQRPVKIIALKDLVVYCTKHEHILQQEAQSHLPTKFGLFEIHLLKSKFNSAECIVLSTGDISKKDGILTRIHSECFTGDSLGSLRCDCGDQLHQSLQLLSKAPAGMLIYLKQEGRGIGLTNKIKAYHLQDAGYDTIAANLKLGFAADLREYGMAYQALRFFGITTIKLITNNPDKIAQLTQFGITITERIPLEIPAQQYNKQYLETKKYKLGHLLSHI